MFGAARPLDWLSRGFAVVLVALAVLTYVRLQGVAFRLRAQEARSRWASNLRDVVNLGALAILFAAFLASGCSAPVAMLFAGTSAVLLEAVRHGGEGELGRPRASLAAGLASALPLAFFSDRATEVANRIAEWLFH